MSNSRPPYDGAGDAGQNPQQPGFSQGNYPPAQGYAPNGGYAPNDAYGQGYAPQNGYGQPQYGQQGYADYQQPMVSRDTSSHTVSKVISSRMGRAMSRRAISSHTPSSLISSSRMTSRGLCSPAGISSPTSSRGISRGTASRIRRKRDLPPEQQYAQYTPDGQRVYPTSGRSGFRVQPAAHREIPWDTIAKVLMFGVLPILFILSMVFAWTAVKWVVLVGAVASIGRNVAPRAGYA